MTVDFCYSPTRDSTKTCFVVKNSYKSHVATVTASHWQLRDMLTSATTVLKENEYFDSPNYTSRQVSSEVLYISNKSLKGLNVNTGESFTVLKSQPFEPRCLSSAFGVIAVGGSRKGQFGITICKKYPSILEGLKNDCKNFFNCEDNNIHYDSVASQYTLLQHDDENEEERRRRRRRRHVRNNRVSMSTSTRTNNNFTTPLLNDDLDELRYPAIERIEPTITSDNNREQQQVASSDRFGFYFEENPLSDSRTSNTNNSLPPLSELEDMERRARVYIDNDFRSNNSQDDDDNDDDDDVDIDIDIDIDEDVDDDEHNDDNDDDEIENSEDIGTRHPLYNRRRRNNTTTGITISFGSHNNPIYIPYSLNDEEDVSLPSTQYRLLRDNHPTSEDSINIHRLQRANAISIRTRSDDEIGSRLPVSHAIHGYPASTYSEDDVKTYSYETGGYINNCITLYSPSPNRLNALICNNDCTLGIFQLYESSYTMTQATRLPVPPNHASISPDQKTIVAVGDSPELFIFHPEERSKSMPLTSSSHKISRHNSDSIWRGADCINTHTESGFSTAFSPSGSLFTITSQDGQTFIFDSRFVPTRSNGLRSSHTFDSFNERIDNISYNDIEPFSSTDSFRSRSYRESLLRNALSNQTRNTINEYSRNFASTTVTSSFHTTIDSNPKFRSLSCDPVFKFYSTRPRESRGAFRCAKFSSSTSDLLAVTEQWGRVHLLDLRDLESRTLLCAGPTGFPHAGESYPISPDGKIDFGSLTFSANNEGRSSAVDSSRRGNNVSYFHESNEDSRFAEDPIPPSQSITNILAMGRQQTNRRWPIYVDTPFNAERAYMASNSMEKQLSGMCFSGQDDSKLLVAWDDGIGVWDIDTLSRRKFTSAKYL